jgi:hypothetical protein
MVVSTLVRRGDALERRLPRSFESGKPLMPWYAVLSAGCRETVELLPTREEAERFVAEAVADEPEFEGLLSVEPVDLPEPSAN